MKLFLLGFGCCALLAAGGVVVGWLWATSHGWKGIE